MGRPKGSVKPDILWVTDPWDKLRHRTDTTLRLVQESLTQGFRSFWCDYRSIRFESGSGVLVNAREFLALSENRESVVFSPVRVWRASDFPRIAYRVDPPVTEAYRAPLQLLKLDADRTRKAKIINPAEALLTFGEKITGLWQSPATAVSSQLSELQRFFDAYPVCVLKPLNEARGRGVALLDWRTPGQRRRAKSHIEKLTECFTRPVLLQEFLPEVQKNGETRLWFSGGHLVACVKKVPAKGDFLFRMHEGGKLRPTRLLAHQKKAALEAADFLKKEQILWAAVDLIGSAITDFNLTSPGLIVEIEEALNVNIANSVIKSII